MKKILIGVVGLVIVASLAFIVLVGNLDKILKGAIESIGSDLLGVPVTISAVEIDLKSGSGQISGFTIANPPGYTAKNAFQMNKIRLEIDIGSLGKQPIVISELNIQNPKVELEAREDGSSNLQTLLNNIEKNSAQADKKAAEQQPETEGVKKGEPLRISFNKLSISGVTVNAIVPSQEPDQVVIPDIVMENVGGASGLTPAEVGSLIIGDIIGQSLKSALGKKFTEKVSEATKDLVDDIRRKLTSD